MARCPAVITISDTTYRCQYVEGHGTPHMTRAEIEVEWRGP